MKTIGKKIYNERTSGLLFSLIVVSNLVLVLLSAVLYRLTGVWQTLSEMPDWYIYVSFLLPQFSAVLVILYAFIGTQATPKEIFRPTKWQYFLIAVLLQIGFFSLSWVNGWFVDFLKNFIPYQGGVSVPSVQGWRIVPVLLVLALFPAVLEETVFRGLILFPLKKFSAPFAVLVSGLLFSLYHQSAAQTLYQFICGCAFALLVLRSGSVLPTVLAHFFNNAFILVYFALTGREDLPVGTGTTVFYLFSGVLLVGTLTYLVFFDRNGEQKKSGDSKGFWAYASVGIAICVLFWVAGVVAV